MSLRYACVGLLVLVLGAGNAFAQQTRIITGTVKESVTNEAVPGATVIVKGTGNGAITEIDGSFTLAGVPAQEVVLQIASASHQAKEITVPAEQGAVKIELDLAKAEEIVITGRAPQLFRKNLANGASVVGGDALVAVPEQTVDAALQGKIAGANIQANSGAPGGGLQIKLRGVSTVEGRSQPLYVVDGVIISDTAVGNGLNAVTRSAGGSNASNQDNPVNRIADLNPNDIENIEVLKGASAAALYGSKASNGVVIITTKRGRAGAPKVSFTQRFGFSQIANKFGSRVFETVDEAIEQYSSLPEETVRALYGDGTVHDHEAQLSQVKLARETAATVSGGTKDTKYMISASAIDTPGILRNTGHSKETARIALDQDFGSSLKVSFTSTLIHSLTARGATNNDNNGVSHYMVLSSTPSFLDLRRFEDGTYPINPFVTGGNNPLQLAALMEEGEDLWRSITSSSANWKIWSNESHALNLSGLVGVDRFQQRNDMFFPRELHFEFSDDGLGGTSIAATTESRNLNAGLTLLHTFTPKSNAFRTVSSVGLFFDEAKLNTNYLFARGLTGGLNAPQAGSSLQTNGFRSIERDQAIAIQEEVLALDDRLAVLVALLADRSSVNGDPDRFFLYPKASAAYRIPLDAVDLLRVRGAYGETGNKPQYGRTFDNLAANATISGIPGLVVPARAGNPDLVPERQREFEGGFDLSAMDGRAVVELTLYQRNISDLLLDRRLPPSTGYTLQTANLGSLRNRGVELMLQLVPVRTPDFQVLSRTIFSLNRSLITDLDVPSFRTGGFGTSLGEFRIEDGKSVTQIVGNALDADGNILRDAMGNPAIVPLGDTEPTFRMSFVHDVSYKGFTLHTLLDWQQGSQIINLTRLLYDSAGVSPDYDADIDENGQGAGLRRLLAWVSGDTAQYVEDATFLKVREIALSYDLPKELVTQLGAVDSLRLSLSGRNLLTFTTYSGLDPEVSNFGNQAVARNIDVAPYPPARSFWFSLEAGF